MRASAPHACSSTLGMPPSILPPSLEAFAVRAAGHTYILHAHLMGAAPALLSAQCNLEKLVSRSGNASAAWWLCSDGLSSASRVISLGIRSDALFEVEFVRRFLGARVFAFDSTMSANEFRRIIDTNSPARTSSEQRMLKFWSFRIERVLELACLARADVMKIDLAAATWGLFERGNASRFFGTDSGMAALLRRVPPLQISIATRGGDDTYGAAATPSMTSESNSASSPRHGALQAISNLLHACGYILRRHSRYASSSKVLYVRAHTPERVCSGRELGTPPRSG